ncbi:MAG TPA: hypothetical protein VN598_15310 [Usitatibacter sp.]|nr:hypothetical protein [Usitatibacter sp.]
MRDRPAFHEVEAPPVSPGAIDGMTDEQWAARNERRAERYRRVLGTIMGLVIGLFFGLAAASRLDPGARHYGIAALLVIGGSILLFVTLLTSNREREIPRLALWVIAPELMALESMPWWLTLLLGIFAVAGVVLVAATVIVGHLPWPFT